MVSRFKCLSFKLITRCQHYVFHITKEKSDKVCQVVVWTISAFSKALIDNQLLHTVLKSLIHIFVEMHLDGVSCIPIPTFETGCLLLFLFSVISYSFTKK